MSKTALCTGITGQAGRYIAELLLSKGYKVYGMIRRSSTVNTERIAHLLDDITLLNGDLADQSSITHCIDKAQPDEVYNLAAQSFVAVSWKIPIVTGDVTGLGAIRVLEAIREVNPKIKFLQASSSEMYGQVRQTPQTELTPFHPRSPYACAKCFAHYATVNYRESYDMFAATSICFNMESPHRGIEFVTKKITDGIVKIKKGQAKELRLGNIEASRDFCYVGDCVKAMHMIMQHDKPDDFVVSTGETHTIREFLEIAFSYVGLRWQDFVVIDQSLIRPAEVNLLLGDSSKVQKALGWKPEVKFYQLVEMMMKAELKEVA